MAEFLIADEYLGSDTEWQAYEASGVEDAIHLHLCQAEESPSDHLTLYVKSDGEVKKYPVSLEYKMHVSVGRPKVVMQEDGEDDQ